MLTETESIVSLFNFNDNLATINLEEEFAGETLALILLSSDGSHVVNGEYICRDFTLYPFESVSLTFIE